MAKFNEFYENIPEKDGMKPITYEQFTQIRESGEDYVLLDVLSEDSYNEGHIEGSESFPLEQIDEETANSTLSKDDNIIVYCGSFACHASTNAARKLSKLGFRVLDYEGGLQDWENHGNELVS